MENTTQVEEDSNIAAAVSNVTLQDAAASSHTPISDLTPTTPTSNVTPPSDVTLTTPTETTPPDVPGFSSIAVGAYAVALGAFSVALGDNIRATRDREVVIGKQLLLDEFVQDEKARASLREWWSGEDVKHSFAVKQYLLPAIDFNAVVTWLEIFFGQPLKLDPDAHHYSLSIGTGAEAKQSFSVALGDNTKTTTVGQVVLGEQLLVVQPAFEDTRNAALKWWNSQECKHFMLIHKYTHTANDYARMVEWLEKYFCLPFQG